MRCEYIICYAYMVSVDECTPLVDCGLCRRSSPVHIIWLPYNTPGNSHLPNKFGWKRERDRADSTMILSEISLVQRHTQTPLGW